MKLLVFGKTGQVARVVADAFAGQPLAARVLSIAPSVDAQRGAIEVKLTLDAPAPAFLREDMTVSVEVETARRERALVLPLAALRTALPDGSAAVMVSDAGVARSRAVKLGLRTLDARLRVHQENAGALADRFAGHPAVRATHYPGLASHPGHRLAARQQRGFGAMLSFDLHGGVPAVRAFLEPLRHVTLAESLGGVESLVAHPATMTHAAMSADARNAAGIGDGLLRLSVGIEALDDLAADLVQALDAAHRATESAVAAGGVA